MKVDKRKNKGRPKVDHPLYSTWKSMLNRCNNPNNVSYKYYGGKGVKVCKEWFDFKTFVADVEPKPDHHTLDRKDTNGNYSKENCKWSTKFEQMNNQTSNLKLNYQGLVVTEAELSRLTSVSRTTIQTRRNRGASVYEMINGFS